MPRPIKYRRVCEMPPCSVFFCVGAEKTSDAPLEMTVEEYETIRLIDYVGLTQEQCAEQMSVARSTVQRIYNDARQKLAGLLVEGRRLVIQGGSYALCDQPICGCGQNCQRRQCHCGCAPCPQNKKGDST